MMRPGHPPYKSSSTQPGAPHILATVLACHLASKKPGEPTSVEELIDRPPEVRSGIHCSHIVSHSRFDQSPAPEMRDEASALALALSAVHFPLTPASVRAESFSVGVY